MSNEKYVLDEEMRTLIFRAIDQSVSQAEFDLLQNALDHSEEVRFEYYRAVNLCESLREFSDEKFSGEPGNPDGQDAPPASRGSSEQSQTVSNRFSEWDLRSPKLMALAAALLALVSGVAYWFGQNKLTTSPVSVPVAESGVVNDDSKESLIAGHATLRRSVDVLWSNAVTYHDGDLIPQGLLQFDDGVAEFDFFCGATLVVEGPASLNVESDWSVRVVEGRLRANVPRAARGFVVKVADSEIVDLGTEFALEVAATNARVEVIDGEIKLRGGEHDGDHLVTGQQQQLNGSLSPEVSLRDLSTGGDLKKRREAAQEQRFSEWKSHSRRLGSDQRLIAFFPISKKQSERIVVNVAETGDRNNGQLVGPVDRTTGRFGDKSYGLNFNRPGGRVRTRIDGEFQAFTFSCWVRIDSLDNVYNSLFMADGYENGEPHWQIHQDGRLMFSVMVDDTKDVRVQSAHERNQVKDAGLHRVYFTEPVWDISKSGRWFHIASVYDPVGRRVDQYVNGRQVGSEEIVDEFYVKQLRIGTAEIGNWGQPFRESPWFAVRNFGGTIDELAIFDAALTSIEIQSLFEDGKPLGY